MVIKKFLIKKKRIDWERAYGNFLDDYTFVLKICAT